MASVNEMIHTGCELGLRKFQDLLDHQYTNVQLGNATPLKVRHQTKVESTLGIVETTCAKAKEVGQVLRLCRAFRKRRRECDTDRRQRLRLQIFWKAFEHTELLLCHGALRAVNWLIAGEIEHFERG